jgi:recombination protein RecA
MDKDKNLQEAFDILDENPYATYLSNSTLTNVDTWFDTGSYALNAIISGKLKEGGVPKGRVVILAGETGTGKTLLINKILGLAQRQGIHPVIFDSEFAVDSQSAINVGLDPEKTKYIPVDTIEGLRNTISKFLDKVIENGLQGKFIISIDSLGNLSSEKEQQDIQKDKAAADMGSRAKGIKSLLRTLTLKAGQAGVTVLISNHTYSDPVAMYPSIIKNQSGGSGPLYMASVIVQLAKKNEKADTDSVDEILPEAKNYSGATLRALTVKNRFVPPFLEASLYLNFLKGLDKYSGLFEMAVNHGILIQTGSTFTMPDGTKLGYRKNFVNENFYEEVIIPGLETILSEKYKYSNNQPIEKEIIDEEVE